MQGLRSEASADAILYQKDKCVLQWTLTWSALNPDSAKRGRLSAGCQAVCCLFSCMGQACHLILSLLPGFAKLQLQKKSGVVRDRILMGTNSTLTFILS